MVASSPRIALTPMEDKWQDFFLYSSPNDAIQWSHVSRETIGIRVIILLISSVKH